ADQEAAARPTAGEGDQARDHVKPAVPGLLPALRAGAPAARADARTGL
ncbi:MAG: Acetoacetyl-CoA synthetase, partial [uncultured Ramlibacter sp.]